MATHGDEEFLKKLEDAMRAEFFPNPQANGATESLEQHVLDRLESWFPKLFGGPTPRDVISSNNSYARMSDLTRQLEQWNSTSLAQTAAQGAALQSLAQRLQELPLEGQARDQVDSIAHSTRMIQTSTAYSNRTLDSMIPMLKGMTDLLFDPQLDGLADASLSLSERASRSVAFIKKMRKLPGFSEGIEELSHNVPGLSSLMNNQLDSLLSRMRDFEAAAKRPMLPDLRGLPEFRYQCLATPSSIRVLKVEALDDTTGDINPNLIKLRLDEVNLAENPEFNALSYVWGDHRAPLGQDNSRNRAKRSFSVLCNGQVMSVTYNLFCFLRRISSARQGALKDIRGMPLWVDQLCINQSDNVEKTVQVAMMDRVYAEAEKVVSWLGESDIQIEGAVRLLQRLKHVPPSRVSPPNFNVAQFVKDVPNNDWLALGALLSRPYFKRAWIVQEIAMAKELLIVCGHYTLHWDDLAHCSAILETSRAWTMLSRFASVFRSVQDHLSLDGQRGESLHYGGQLAALIEAQSTIRNPLVAPENLLLLGKQFDATVPVDKYFAMLGLYRNRLGDSASIGGLPSVDYSKSLKHVALDFARYHIRVSGSLRILSLVEDPSYRSHASIGFPSWLPDPTAPLRPLPLDTDRWRTTQAHLPCKPPRVEGGSLHTQGRKLTAITVTATPFSTLQQTNEWFHLFDFLSTFAQPTSNIPLDTALWRTLTTTPLPLSPKSPDTARPTLADDFAAWCISLASSAGNPNDADMFDALMAETMQQSYSIDDIQFDGLVFGRDAAPILEAAESPDVRSAVERVLRRSEIRLAYMDRREKAEREGVVGGVKLRGQIEDALKRVWEVCVGGEQETAFPDPRRVREGLEVLDRFAEDREEEKKAMQHRIDRFSAAIGSRLDSRRLFFTEDGRLGMGPESSCNGDQVWEIDGLPVPAVIRRLESEAFRYVGQAFVLGLTPGEGLARTDVVQLADLELR